MRWTVVLSRTKDEDGETTTWLVEVSRPQEQEPAHDDDQDQDDTVRADEGRD